MISYLDKKDLKSSISKSEKWMQSFQDSFDENERVANGRPGKVPKGHPNVTDGTTQSIVEETPERTVQQLPTGNVTVKNFPDLEDHVNAVLSDDILKHANSGGDPWSKFLEGGEQALTTGSAFFYAFYNRRGDWFGADFKLVNPRDVFFEEGKTSEYDCNFMFMVGWYTLNDLKNIREFFKKQKQAENVLADEQTAKWNFDVLDELIEGGESPKDEENKSSEEKKVTTEENGYIKLIHCFQVGVKAEWFTYSQKLDKIAKTDVNLDPRGVIPIHGLYYRRNSSTPYGKSMVSKLVGKQNLTDFEMQGYQFNRGYGMYPTLLSYGIPKHKAIIAPNNVIDMGSPAAGNKLETLNIDTSAIRDFPNVYQLLQSQLYNHSGFTPNPSISATAGNIGFSKTDSGVDALQAKLGVSDNHFRKNIENLIERLYETLLNIHFAYGKGKKEIELQVDTAKRLKMEKGSALEVDFDEDYGKIEFSVDAGTTEAADNQKESEQLTGILELTSKFGGLSPDKQMLIINQIIQNSGVDDPEKLKYTDEEIEEVKKQQEMQKQMAIQKQRMQAKQAQQAELMAQQTQIPSDGPQMQPQPGQLSDDEQAAVQQLIDRGVPQEDIATVLAMLREGYSDEEVMSVLQGAQQGVPA